MSKKRKKSIAKLSDADYNQYIMALKDERPVKVIIPDDEKDSAKKKQ